MNIPIDTSFYRWNYPNPFTPPNINQKFIYQLSNKTDIQINILNIQDSVLSNINLTEQIRAIIIILLKVISLIRTFYTQLFKVHLKIIELNL